MDDPLNKETADLQRRLAELDRERASLLTALEQLKLRSKAAAQPTLPMQTAGGISTTTPLSNAKKVALFHSLFHGRDDVFPRRWENSKRNKVGYAPACHNEWVRGICEKPRIKCGRRVWQFDSVATTERTATEGKQRLRERRTATI